MSIAKTLLHRFFLSPDRMGDETFTPERSLTLFAGSRDFFSSARALPVPLFALFWLTWSQ